MFKTFAQQLKPSLLMLFWMTLLTGLAYPLAMTGLGKALFPAQAEGSLIVRGGTVVGSALIGQPFQSDRYFWGRPSATSPSPDNAAQSSGSNLGPSNQALADGVAERAAKLKDAHGDSPVPMELATASASGLDPHISPEAALYQAARVAKARGLSVQAVSALVEKHVEGRLLGFWGEPRVNVLDLNLALDAAPGKE
ncbi:potassium-transporting ATPase subunit KdpC [Fundidesulfovibrio terrae]|uniref:potassium-transporting ATPase subunit KdpC n=1 Tax=Fundidesulfovibrio terrae TaxID=2922866 RepID=UPI001FB03D59|nr:potassium-transporting ATPase subunit KdpC [Fundidesulfovibrio terrae]